LENVQSTGKKSGELGQSSEQNKKIAGWSEIPQEQEWGSQK